MSDVARIFIVIIIVDCLGSKYTSTFLKQKLYLVYLSVMMVWTLVSDYLYSTIALKTTYHAAAAQHTKILTAWKMA